MAPPRPIRYRLSPAAQSDLENIWLHSREKWSVAQADRYLAMIEAMIKEGRERILTMPELAPERAEFNPPVRIHPNGGHLLVYRTAGEYLDIIRILGGKQYWHLMLEALQS